jgi:hypothetical protein
MAVVMGFHNYKSCSFLMRIWQDNPEGGFRASVLNVQNPETQSFSSLAALFEFITRQSEQADPAEMTTSTTY